MASIIEQPLPRNGIRHRTAKIDMTPMVDLGFLLISFFIFTTSLTRPAAMKLTMPKAGANPPLAVYEKALLTAVIAPGGVWVYEGALPKALAKGAVQQTSLHATSGFGELIRQKQLALAAENRRDDLTVLLKPLPSASYQHLIDALDELTLHGVSRYAVIDATEAEHRLVKQ